MITALILLAVIATDVAVGVLFVTVRRGMLAPRPALDNRRSAEMEELVIRLRAQAEQAVAELNRQKAQLHRMLAEFGRDQQVTEVRPVAVAGGTPALAAVPASSPMASFDLEPQNVVRLAAEGLSERAIAGRTGTSVEAVRLMLAMAGNQATA